MKPGWIIGIAMLFILMSVVCAVCELHSPLATGEVPKLQALMSPDFPDYNIPIIGQVAGFISVAWGYIKILWKMFWFDYPFLEGTWLLARYIFFIPVSIGLIVSLVLAAIRGVSA